MNGPSGVRRVGEATGRHGSRARRRGCISGPPQASGVRPRLLAEWLEQRLLLSTYTVTSTADVAGTDSNYVGTLRWAVAQADAADAPTSSPSLIAFAPALFSLPQTITLTQGELRLTQGATTLAGAGPGLLTVSGNNATRVLEVDATATASVSGLTITRGNVGAGMSVGGGVINAGTLTISGSALTSSTAGYAGGGIYNTGSLTLTGSTLSGDTAGTEGGGIASVHSAFVADCTLAADSAPSGGGVYTSAGVTLTSDTLSGNSASSHGGGVFAAAAVPLFNTLVAADTGGDLYAFSGGGFSGSFSGSYDLVGDGSPGLSASASAHNVLDAGAGAVGPLGDYGGPTQTVALPPGSPAIGAGAVFRGPDFNFLTTDQRGISLSQPHGVDIGAFESTPLVVNTAADDPIAAGQLSLRDCVNLANVADAPAANPSAISFDPTVFAGPNTITLAQGQLELAAGATTITGPGASSLTVSGNGKSRVLLVDAGVTQGVVSGLMISHGTSLFGGGIFNYGKLTITDSTLSGDSAGSGDGGGIENDGTLTISGSTLSNDSANYGGGIENDGTLTVSDSTLSADSATFQGGGQGGGILNNNGTLTVSDSTLSADSASKGGGIYSYSSTPVGLNNDLVAANTSATGGDLYTLPGTGQGDSYSGSDNLIGNGTGETGLNNGTSGNQVGTASSPINPMLGPLQDDGGPTQTLALLPGSPAIDAGSNALIPAGVTTDQRGAGYPRVANGTVDIGAYEVQPAAAAPTVTGVSVDSTQWAASFPYAAGYAVPTGSSQLTDLPWTNLNQVKMTFSEAVNVAQGSLVVTGINKASYAISGFSYNAATFTATWTFAAALGDDKLKFDLAASGANAVTGANGGVALDGTFANGSGSFPSGGNAPGTDFVYDLDVLPGDVQQKGGPVNILEVIQTRNDQLKKPGDAGYSPFYDVDGSGSITILDVINVRNRQLSKLPAGTP